MGNIYGEQYVFTDPDIRVVQATVIPKDTVLDRDYYSKLKTHDAVTIPEGSDDNKSQEWQKIAMCHNDKVELAVDNNWINATPLDVNPDAVSGEYDDIAGGFVLFHTQQDALRGKIDTEKVIQIIKSSKQKGDKEEDGFTYGDVLQFKYATVDNAGHITDIIDSRFLMPGIYDKTMSNKEWKTQADTDNLGEERNPLSAKVVAPAMIYLQDEVTQLKKEVQGTSTSTGDGDPAIPNEDLGLLTRVSTLENEVTNTENIDSHINRIATLENEVGITSNANKPGLEFKVDSSLYLRPVEEDTLTTFIKTGNKATVLNTYTNEEIPISYDTSKTYLKNTNKAIGIQSLASGKGTFAIGSYSNASGFATAALSSSTHVEGASLVLDTDVASNIFKVSKIDKNPTTLTYTIENLSSILDSFPKDEDITLDIKKQYLENCMLGVPIHTTTNKDYYVKLFLHDGSITKSNNTIANTIKFTIDKISDLPDGVTVDILKDSQQKFVYLHCGSAYGRRSHTENYGTITKAKDSHAEGCLTCAEAESSHAEGGFTIADGKYSHTEGRFTTTTSNGKYSHAEGYKTTTSNEGAHAEGESTIASGKASHAEGKSSIASGNYSHAEGENTTASGVGAHAEGQNTEANQKGSHAEGGGTTASGEYSHAEGCSTGTEASETSKGSVASARGAHAEGGSTTASGLYAHAEGQDTTANKQASHAAGWHTQTTSAYQTVVGKYNNANQGLFVVGNGTDGDLSNAFRVTSTGVYGNTYSSNNADYAEYFEWEDQNLNNEDRIGYFVSFGNEDMIRLGGEDEILGVVSGTAIIIGNDQEDNWSGKYEKDIYGRIIYEDYIDANGISSEIPKISSTYDPNKEYIPRSKRPEWAVIGMLGRLIVRDDGSCIVGKYCKSNNKGIATASATGYRVLKRLDESHIQILFK